MKVDFHYLWSGKYAQWIAIALISFFSSLIIIEFFSLRFTPIQAQIAPEPGKGVIPVAQKEDSFNDIIKASLFGVYVSNDLSDGSVKKSMLNVTLVGILFAGNMEDSQVIIRAENGEEKTYKIGDTIPGDAVVKRITANGVLVERQGALESLSLPKNELIFEPVAKPLKGE